MTRKNKLILAMTAGIGLLLASALAVYVLFYSDWPGGMRPTYPARDYDTRLTRVAATATPVIAALDRYHKEHSVYPTRKSELTVYLSNSSPLNSVPATDEILRWDYTPTGKGQGYELSRKLGWDPSLAYCCDSSQTNWVFSPGDGSDGKIIQLKP